MAARGATDPKRDLPITHATLTPIAGKLGAWPCSVSMPAKVPLSRPQAERRTSDPRVDALEACVLPVLQQQSADLAERWTTQAQSVLLLGGADRQSAARVMDAQGLVGALIAAFASGDSIPKDSVRHGMQFGAAAFARGVSVHHVLKAIDLLMAMMLFALESALGEVDAEFDTNAADGVRLSRRLQRGGALLSLAVTRGYMQAYADALRDRFRHLRHDLRNPLGTIKSVLALMDDDSVPFEARANPAFRGMAVRNANLLEELIADRLGDAVVLPSTVAGQDVSIPAIVHAVRRELRAEAERRGVSIVVEPGGPLHGSVDAAGLDLLLHEVLQATLRECQPGERLHIDVLQTAGRATFAISCESGRSLLRIPGVLERVSALAGQIGATIAAGERTTISVPFRPGGMAPSREHDRMVPRDSAQLSDGEALHDLGGAREGHHGQTSAH
jgi:signal transduction histidine kinase